VIFLFFLFFYFLRNFFVIVFVIFYFFIDFFFIFLFFYYFFFSKEDTRDFFEYFTLQPRTGNIIKNGLSVIERGENLLQYTLFQSLEIVLQSYRRIYTAEKLTFPEGACHLKG